MLFKFTRLYEDISLDINDELEDRLYTIFEDGKLAMLCPKCKSVTYFDIDKDKRLYTIDYNKKDDDSPTYTCACKKCGTIVTQGSAEFLDPNIALAVSYLNKAGYETVGSCEGHPDSLYSSSFSLPYISFKERYDISVTDLPEGWVENKISYDPEGIYGVDKEYYEELNKRFTIYYPMDYSQIATYEYNNYLKNKIISDITKWALNLLIKNI